MAKELKLGWTVTEIIGVGIINPKAVSRIEDPFWRVANGIRDFCYEHSSKEEMRNFLVKMLVKYPTQTRRIKDEILKICPQYEEMIEKIIILA